MARIVGVAGGAGMITGRAIIRDVYQGAAGQRAIPAGDDDLVIAPVVAPIIGGFVRPISAGGGVRVPGRLCRAVLLLAWWRLPETLAPEHRQSFSVLARQRLRVDLLDGLVLAAVRGADLVFPGLFSVHPRRAGVRDASPRPVAHRVLLGVRAPSVVGTMTGAALSARTAGRSA
ncbi:MAG: hypothetical protein R3E68_04640 [Burkholderiaceae bacterium]